MQTADLEAIQQLPWCGTPALSEFCNNLTLGDGSAWRLLGEYEIRPYRLAARLSLHAASRPGVGAILVIAQGHRGPGSLISLTDTDLYVC